MVAVRRMKIRAICACRQRHGGCIEWVRRVVEPLSAVRANTSNSMGIKKPRHFCWGSMFLCQSLTRKIDRMAYFRLIRALLSTIFA